MAGQEIPRGSESPQERTQRLKTMTAAELRDLLLSRSLSLAIAGTDRAVIVIEAEAFSQVGPWYKGISGLQEGVVWNPPAQRRAATQTLLVTRKEAEPGSCVRIMRVEYWDPEKQKFAKRINRDGRVYGNAESHIAAYFRLARNQVSHLAFLDQEENTLFIISPEHGQLRSQPHDAEPQEPVVDPRAANRRLEDFLSSE